MKTRGVVPLVGRQHAPIILELALDSVLAHFISIKIREEVGRARVFTQRHRREGLPEVLPLLVYIRVLVRIYQIAVGGVRGKPAHRRPNLCGNQNFTARSS